MLFRSLKVIAREYAANPQGTLVVSPDNESRRAINQVIHREMQTRGQVDANEQKYRVLVARHEITGVDRQWAAQSHSTSKKIRISTTAMR